LHRQTFEVFGVQASFDEKGDPRGPLGEPAMRVWLGGTLKPAEE
jgi:hypothetical protein